MPRMILTRTSKFRSHLSEAGVPEEVLDSVILSNRWRVYFQQKTTIQPTTIEKHFSNTEKPHNNGEYLAWKTYKDFAWKTYKVYTHQHNKNKT